MPLVPEKKCKKCGIVKSLSQFRNYKTKKNSGLRNVCTSCEKWKSPKGYMNKFNKNDSHKRAVKNIEKVNTVKTKQGILIIKGNII